MNTELILTKIHSLTVFRALVKDPVIDALCTYLSSILHNNKIDSVDAYCDFVSKLYNLGNANLSDYIQSITNDDENVYICSAASSKEPDEVIKSAVRQELDILQEIADLTCDELISPISHNGYLPKFKSSSLDIARQYVDRCQNVARYGYGIYSRDHMFYLDKTGVVTPVCVPDDTRLSQLIDYKAEQKIILDNTHALLNNKPAANVLLTGDAGTGKSSTVKAIVNELYCEGLRIIEVRKDQLDKIPALIDHLSKNPLKFIIFIDDLSFAKDDDNFSALKAILEGSVSAKSTNTVIYATSNRRHIVKEKFSDREGDDIHRNDTIQEIISLSERFGIHVTFQRPNKKTYLNIVHHLAKENGLDMADDELDTMAERFALGRGNRSARAAKQFVDSLLTK